MIDPDILWNHVSCDSRPSYTLRQYQWWQKGRFRPGSLGLGQGLARQDPAQYAVPAKSIPRPKPSQPSCQLSSGPNWPSQVAWSKFAKKKFIKKKGNKKVQKQVSRGNNPTQLIAKPSKAQTAIDLAQRHHYSMSSIKLNPPNVHIDISTGLKHGTQAYIIYFDAGDVKL